MELSVTIPEWALWAALGALWLSAIVNASLSYAKFRLERELGRLKSEREDLRAVNGR